jgi:phosphoribosylformimino-5-aminoimidazole carboxamide ribotide isomerase
MVVNPLKIIPAIDILGGKCVRLSQGNYDTEQVYHENPVEVAKKFEAAGIKNLHLIDLDGARSKQIMNDDILAKIATKTSLNIDFGGGIKSTRDAHIALDSGAAKINVSSIAVENRALFLEWLENFGADKIILSADCKNRKISTRGWTQTSEIDIIGFIREFESQGLKNVVCTDISKDGMLQGPSFELYRQILAQTNVNLIASGGVRSIDDLKKLESIGCAGAIIGKAIYEEKIALGQLSQLC